MHTGIDSIARLWKNPCSWWQPITHCIETGKFFQKCRVVLAGDKDGNHPMQAPLSSAAAAHWLKVTVPAAADEDIQWTIDPHAAKSLNSRVGTQTNQVDTR